MQINIECKILTGFMKLSFHMVQFCHLSFCDVTEFDIPIYMFTIISYNRYCCYFTNYYWNL